MIERGAGGWSDLAVVAMLKAPAGLWGLVLERFGFELFPVRRRLVPARSPPRDT